MDAESRAGVMRSAWRYGRYQALVGAKRWYALPEYAEAIEARRGVANFVTTLLPGTAG